MAEPGWLSEPSGRRHSGIPHATVRGQIRHPEPSQQDVGVTEGHACRYSSGSRAHTLLLTQGKAVDRLVTRAVGLDLHADLGDGPLIGLQLVVVAQISGDPQQVLRTRSTSACSTEIAERRTGGIEIGRRRIAGDIPGT